MKFHPVAYIYEFAQQELDERCIQFSIRHAFTYANETHVRFITPIIFAFFSYAHSISAIQVSFARIVLEHTVRTSENVYINSAQHTNMNYILNAYSYSVKCSCASIFCSVFSHPRKKRKTETQQYTQSNGSTPNLCAKR